MKLFSKKNYPYIFLILLFFVLIIISYFSNTFVETFKNSENNNNLDELSIDSSKIYSSSPDDKFQYLSCIFEENHPPKENINISTIIIVEINLYIRISEVFL